jgi:hypothetical protein
MVRKKLLTRRRACGASARQARFGLLALTLLIAVTVACRPGGPLKVATIQTGKSLNSDRSVGIHTTRFKPNDTLYAAVLTEGPGAGTFVARWTYGGRLVSEDTRKVSYGDSAATEFHIQSSGGFPAGDYAVELLLDGTSIGTRNLRVEK